MAHDICTHWRHHVPSHVGAADNDPYTTVPYIVTGREQSVLTQGRLVYGDHPVASGTFGDVWKGRFVSPESGHSSTVAVKVLRSGTSIPDLEHVEPTPLCLSGCVDEGFRFWESLDHKNIVPLHGTVAHPDHSPALVSPWYENGSADAFLQGHPTADPMKIIRDVAEGMEYLHSHHVVHGDLKATNVLIDDGGNARLCDFGLTPILESLVGLQTSSPSTVRWMAPELLTSDAPSSRASDVYSFACTALELLTGQIPYGTMSDRAVLLKVLHGTSPRHLSGEFHCDIPYADELWALLERCWADAEQRPGIAEVRKCLEMLQGHHRTTPPS